MEEAIRPLLKAYDTIYKGLTPPEWHEDAVAGWSSLEVRFAHGSRITALPANPDTARGFSANVFLDEFTFHHDSRKIWAALYPVVSKPGLKLRVVSTPNGKGNKFFELMTTSRGGDVASVSSPREGQGAAARASGQGATLWSRHCVDIYEAVHQGLRVMSTPCARVLATKTCGGQEYELQWLDEASAWLNYELITSCEHDRARANGYSGGTVTLGVDIARRNDLWVAVVLERLGDVLWTREIVTLHRATFAAQDTALDALVAHYRPRRIAIDQTGMGEKPVEDAQRRYGGIVLRV